jgi:hypothetical protein
MNLALQEAAVSKPDPAAGVSLVVWGPSSGGKTVLLAQLYNQVGGQGEWQVFPTKSSLAFIGEMRNLMKVENRFPPATNVGVVDSLAFELRHRERGTVFDLVLEDRAGKDYEDGEASALGRMQDAAGLLLLFDHQRSPAHREREILETMEKLFVDAERRAGADPRPVALCLSKADLLIDSVADLEWARREPDAFVRARVGESVLRALEQYCPCHRLFPISASGVRLRHGVVEPVVFYDETLATRICPQGGESLHLMAPFSWLLAEVSKAS